MSEATNAITQAVLMEVKAAPLPAGNGLAQSRDLLKSINTLMDSIQGKFSGLAQQALPKIDAKAYEEMIKKVQTKAPTGLDPDLLAEQLFDTEALQRQFNKWFAVFKAQQAKVAEVVKRGEFTSVPAAASVFAKFNEEHREAIKNHQDNINRVFGAGMPSTATPRSITAVADKVNVILGEGELLLTVPPERLKVILGEGAVQVVASGGTVAANSGGVANSTSGLVRGADGRFQKGTAGGPGRGGAAGGGGGGEEFVSANGGDDGGSEKGGGTFYLPPSTPSETRRKVRRDSEGNPVSAAITRATDRITQATTFYSEEGEGDTVESIARAKGIRQSIRESLLKQGAVLTEQTTAGLTGNKSGDLREKATGQELWAAAIRTTLDQHREALVATEQLVVVAKMESEAAKALANARRMNLAADQNDANQMRRQQETEERRQQKLSEQRRKQSEQEAKQKEAEKIAGQREVDSRVNQDRGNLRRDLAQQRQLEIEERRAKEREKSEKENKEEQDQKKVNRDRGDFRKELASQKELEREQQKIDAERKRETDQRFAAEARGNLVEARRQEQVRKYREQQRKAQAAVSSGQMMTLVGEGADALVDEYLARGYIETRRSAREKFGAKGRETHESITLGRDDEDEKLAVTLTKVHRAGQLASVSVTDLERKLKDTRAEGSASARTFLTNTEHVTAWAASVGVLYQSIALAKQGIKSFVDQTEDLERLNQVFSHAGGSAERLAGDVLGLAADAGINREQAMGTAEAWAKLGLSLADIRVAAAATFTEANIEGQKASVVADRMVRLYQGYGLALKDLNPALNMVRSVSRNFHVEQEQLMEGLSRGAPLAKRYGVSMAEMAGMVAATMGAANFSGSASANGIQTIISGLADSATQRTLRQGFGVDVAPGGQMKEMSAILSELFLKYQTLTDAEGKYMAVSIAGRNGLSRMVALLDNYVRAQVLAINAQMNLNEAQETSEAINRTLRAELGGVATEFEKFAILQASHGPAQGLSMVAESLKNLLKLLNTGVGSAAVTGFVVLLGTMAARLMLTKVATDAANGSVGILGSSIRDVMMRATSLGTTLQKMVDDLYAVSRGGGAVSQSFANAVKAMNDFGRARIRAGQMDIGQGRVQEVEGGDLGGRALRAGVMARGVAQVAGGGALALTAGALAAVAPIALEIGAVLAVASAGMWAFNRAMDYLGQSSRAVDEALAGYNERLSTMQSRAEAARMAIRLLGTVSQSLATNVSAERRGQMVDMLGGLVGGVKVSAEDRAKLLAAGADRAKIEEVMRPIRDKAVQLRQISLQKAYEETQKQIGIRQAWLESHENSPYASNEVIEKNRNQLAQLQTKAMQLHGDMESGEAADMASRDEQKVATLERMKLVWQSIADIFSSMAAADPLTRYQAGLETLKAQNQVLEHQVQIEQRKVDAANQDGVDREKQRKELMEHAASWRTMAEAQGKQRGLRSAARADSMATDEKLNAEYRFYMSQAEENEQKAQELSTDNDPRIVRAHNRMEELRKEQERIRGTIEGQQSPEVLRAVESQTRIQQAQVQATNASASFGVGYSDTERIMDRQWRLQMAIADAMRRANDEQATTQERAEAVAQALVYQKQLVESGVDASKRRYEIERQYNQLLFDRQRDFSRSLLTDSPDALLKRLAVSSLVGQSGGAVSDRQYIGLGSEGRRLLDEMPGFGFQERQLRREYGIKGGLRDTVADIIDQRNMIGKAGPLVGKTVGLDGFGNEVLQAAQNFSSVVVAAAREMAEIFRGSVPARGGQAHNGGGLSTARMAGYAVGEYARFF